MLFTHRCSCWLWWIGLLATCFCSGPALLAEAAQPAPPIVVKAGTLFDPTSGRMLDHPVIVIRANKIDSVSYGSTVPIPGAKLIDLGDATLLPGFVDVHTHLTMNAGGGGYESLGISAPRAALIGAKNAHLTLMAGFTTVRNVGAEGYADVALRDAINDGDVIGPRMQVSGPPLGITGGHCDNSLLPFEFHYSAEGVAWPGHFELGSKADLQRFRDYLSDLFQQVRAMRQQGDSLEQVQQHLKMEKYADFRQYPKYQATFADNAAVIYQQLQAH